MAGKKRKKKDGSIDDILAHLMNSDCPKIADWANAMYYYGESYEMKTIDGKRVTTCKPARRKSLPVIVIET